MWFCMISTAASNALWQVLTKIFSSPLMFGLFIPQQQYHDYGESANSCTVIKAAYKVRKGWREGESLDENWNGKKVTFNNFSSLNALYILWNKGGSQDQLPQHIIWWAGVSVLVHLAGLFHWSHSKSLLHVLSDLYIQIGDDILSKWWKSGKKVIQKTDYCVWCTAIDFPFFPRATV